VSNDSTQEVALNWVVSGKGRYYIGYIASDLIPYYRESGCIAVEKVFINQVVASDHNTETLPYFDDIRTTSYSTGLNFDIFVYNEYSDLIAYTKKLFSRAIQLSGQINIINTYLTSIRTTGTQRIAKSNADDLLIKLEGYKSETMNVKGLNAYFVDEIKDIKKEIDKLKRGYFAYGFTCNIQQ
jgi:hypothetical protein